MATREEILSRHYPFVAQSDTDGWAIYFPDLPGCQTFAETWDDIGRMAREAFEGWVMVQLDNGRPIADPTASEEVMPWSVDRFTGKAPEDAVTFTTAEVASELGITPMRVRNLARARGLGTKRGHDLRFSRDEVDNMRVRRPGRPASATGA